MAENRRNRRRAVEIMLDVLREGQVPLRHCEERERRSNPGAV